MYVYIYYYYYYFFKITSQTFTISIVLVPLDLLLLLIVQVFHVFRCCFFFPSKPSCSKPLILFSVFFICVCVCVSVCAHVHMCVRACVYLCVCMYACVSVMFVCVCVWMFVYVRARATNVHHWLFFSLCLSFCTWWWLFPRMRGVWENVQPFITCLSFWFLVEISSRTLIPLFWPGSVHSGLASWEDCGRVFPDELRVSSFPDRSPHYAWAAV